MLIGLTGRAGVGQDAVADYLTRAHSFTATQLITDDLVDDLSGHHVVVTTIRDRVDADILIDRGGVIVHLIDPTMPSFGPTNGIALRPIDREIDATRGGFRAFDVLDALVGEAEFLSA